MGELRIQNEYLEMAVRAAREAGNMASSVKQTTEQELKSNNTVVTEADHKAENIVRNILLANTDYSILGEEQGGSIENEDTYWVIDPIDGTKNFSYQQPFYGTAVSLVKNNKPEIGVFYMPELEYLFYAVEGNGAYRNAQKISVTKNSNISDSYIVFSGKGREKIQPSVSEKLNQWNQQFGSAIMGQAWVASGWSDIGIYGSLAPWDMAVGKILIQESGGIMKSVENNSKKWDDVSDGKAIFGNKELVNSTINRNLPEEAENAILNSEYNY